jgi:predicted DNA-binding protein YlxM (UPF0122 family)
MSKPLASVTKSDILKKRKLIGSDAKIAEEYGVSRQALHMHCQKLGVPPIRTKEIIEAKRAKIIKLHLAGKIAHKIASEVDISTTSVYREIKRYLRSLE